MSNSKGRRLFRKYAQHLGREAKEFVKIIDGSFDSSDKLITKNNNNEIEETYINYKDMVHLIISDKINTEKD